MANKIGVGKKMPAGEARPLGSPAKRSHKAKKDAQLKNQPVKPLVADDRSAPAARSEVARSEVAPTGRENISDTATKALDTSATDAVDSAQLAMTPTPSSALSKDMHMDTSSTRTITLKGLSKNGKIGLYSGLRQVIRIPVSAFVGDVAAQSFEATGDFSGPREKTIKVSETPEARKARLAALPKLTLAEKIAKREEALTKLKAKAEKELAATKAPEPELVGAGV